MNKILKELKKYPRFYQEVWLACLKIPKGKTRTYKWLAKQIGCPGACRAVRTALGKNPFAPYVPCHRVIASDGSPGGYSGKGGIKRKIALLKKEGVKIIRGIKNVTYTGMAGQGNSFQTRIK